MHIMNRRLKLWILTGILMYFPPETSFSNTNFQRKISIDVKDVDIVSVFEEIRIQSGYNFIYNENYAHQFEKVTLKLKEADLAAVLNKLFEKKRLGYEIVDNIIYIKPLPSPAGQENPILKGVVKDTEGNVLAGVTVVEKGSLNGVATDINGRFLLKLSAQGKTVRFTFIGKKTKEIIYTGQKEVEIILEDMPESIEEVVVTGYFNTTMRKETGSVTVVPSKIFENKSVSGVDQLLQGQVAGLKVNSSGRPGSRSEIRIRGINTISGNAEPLWVIDGIPLQKNIPAINTAQIKAGDFNDIFLNGIGGINPNDIENVTVLKDAAATAIYGSRAAGGVIVITTKRGQSGKTNISISSNISVQMQPQRDGNLMSATEKLEWEENLWEEFSKEGFVKNEYYPVIGIVGMLRSGWIGKNGKLKDEEGYEPMSRQEQDTYIAGLKKNTTNWFDEIFRNAVSASNHIAISGGNRNVNYYLSFGNTTDKGLLKGTSYDRYTLSTNMDFKPDERTSYNLNIYLSQQKSDGPSLNVNPFLYAYFANPYERPHNEDGSYRGDMTWFNGKRVNGNIEEGYPSSGYNIFREMDETSAKSKNRSANVTFKINYRIWEKLELSGILSYAFTENTSDNINGENTYAAFRDRLFFDYRTKRTYGSITQAIAENDSYSARGQFHYSTDLGAHGKISLYGGTEIRLQKSKSIFSKRYGYDPLTGISSIPLPPGTPDASFDLNFIKQYGQVIDNLTGDDIQENRFASFYSAFDYYYKNRYIFSTSFRTDGSNNFGSKEQFNPTWSIGVAWHIDDEPFMKPLKPVLSHMKLSLAGGYTGNVNHSVRPDIIMKYSSLYRKTEEGNLHMGSILKAPNPHLRWEKTKDLKGSIDFGLFDEIVSGLFEVYYRKSTDLITQVDISNHTGFPEQMFNTSEIENKGIETTLKFRILKGKHTNINLSANLAYNVNKLTKYYKLNAINSDKYVGYPLGAIFSGKYDGINPESGLYHFLLRPDSDFITPEGFSNPENYIFYKGTSNAPWTGGFFFSASYRRLSLSVGGNYSLGAHIKNDLSYPFTYKNIGNEKGEKIQSDYNDLYINFLNRTSDATDRWSPDKRAGIKYPRIIDCYGKPLGLDKLNPYTGGITNAALLQNVSYLRIAALSLSYSLPEHILSSGFLNSVNLSFSLNNIFTFTNYKGLDPENPGAAYPRTRSVSFGINIGF